MTDAERNEAAIIIADLFASLNNAPAACHKLTDPPAAALRWIENWRDNGADVAANPFTGRWILEGPPPWPDDGHIPHRDVCDRPR